jgi:hypothetical protein
MVNEWDRSPGSGRVDSIAETRGILNQAYPNLAIALRGVGDAGYLQTERCEGPR